MPYDGLLVHPCAARMTRFVRISPKLFSLGRPFFSERLCLGSQIFRTFRSQEIGRMRTGILYHFAEFLRVVQHRAGAEHIVVEGLVLMVFHKQRALERFQETAVVDVDIAVMDESTGFHITVGIDV